MDRVAGPDESYLLADELLGYSAPIQALWILPGDPGADALSALRDGLAAGQFDRKVVRTGVPFARDRWVRAHYVPEVGYEPEKISDDEVGAWADRRLRASALAPADGRGWGFESATTQSGKVVISLIVSHMISDGGGIVRAAETALTGTPRSTLPEAHERGGFAGLRADMGDALGQVGAAARAAKIVFSEAIRQRKKTKSTYAPTVDDGGDIPHGDISGGEISQTRTPVRTDADTTLAICDIDRDEWLRVAHAHGGTANTLFTALLGGIVNQVGLPRHDDGRRICIAVSRRGDDDARANASGGVWIRVPGAIGPDKGLGEIRTLSKKAFIDYAESGQDKVADNLQAIARLLPKRVLASMMRSVPGPDTTVSNLGVTPPAILTIGDQVAETFAIRAVMHGRSPADRRAQGPAIAAWLNENPKRFTLSFFGIHPDYFGDGDYVRELIASEFDRWRIAYRFW